MSIVNEPCRCGSGHYPRAVHDARGIFLTFACHRCERERTRGFRPEVLTDPHYEMDEPLDED
jgi:hypothetical protein